METSEILGIALPIVYVLVGIALVWLIIEIIATLRKTRTTIDIIHKQVEPTLQSAERIAASLEPVASKVDPLVERVSLTVDAANLEIMRVDKILEDVNEITDSVSTVVQAVDDAASAPLGIVNSVSSRIRTALKPHKASDESVVLSEKKIENREESPVKVVSSKPEKKKNKDKQKNKGKKKNPKKASSSLNDDKNKQEKFVEIEDEKKEKIGRHGRIDTFNVKKIVNDKNDFEIAQAERAKQDKTSFISEQFNSIEDNKFEKIPAIEKLETLVEEALIEKDESPFLSSDDVSEETEKGIEAVSVIEVAEAAPTEIKASNVDVIEESSDDSVDSKDQTAETEQADLDLAEALEKPETSESQSDFEQVEVSSEAKLPIEPEPELSAEEEEARRAAANESIMARNRIFNKRAAEKQEKVKAEEESKKSENIEPKKFSPFVSKQELAQEETPEKENSGFSAVIEQAVAQVAAQPETELRAKPVAISEVPVLDSAMQEDETSQEKLPISFDLDAEEADDKAEGYRQPFFNKQGLHAKIEEKPEESVIEEPAVEVASASFEEKNTSTEDAEEDRFSKILAEAQSSLEQEQSRFPRSKGSMTPDSRNNV